MHEPLLRAPSDCAALAEHYRGLRQASEALCAPLSAEDCALQSMPDASPAKWHLAHTSWFFEQFILRPHCPGYREFHPQFNYLFNSYYQGAGERHPRPRRGLLSRPSLDEVLAYRHHVDTALLEWLPAAHGTDGAIAALLLLGLNHEQQHQELLLMDIKHLLAQNPLAPAYAPPPQSADSTETAPLGWQRFEGGIQQFGADGSQFCYDNETPQHRALLEPFELATRLVSNGEWRDFIDDGGYQRPQLWLSDGWDWLQAEGVSAPLYWRADGDDWREFSLHGELSLAPARAVSHISYYEADAYARWAGARLPTEYEWELAARESSSDHRQQLEPACANGGGMAQLFGALWQWTRSPYQPYPGFQPLAGVVGEYNGKFMANQMVLRGSACITPAGHSRASYRNFFYPHMRWQYAGLRLARDV